MAEIQFEGYSIDDLFDLPLEEFDAYLFCDEPLVLKIASAEILAQFTKTSERLTLELAQIDGGGEGVLLAISHLAERLCKQRALQEIEWQVHAVHRAQPNLKLRRLLTQRDFHVEFIPNIGEVYHKILPVRE